MTMNGQALLPQTDRHAFLLRIWRETGDVWRVTLQHTRSHETFGFHDLAEAFAFVDALCAAAERI